MIDYRIMEHSPRRVLSVSLLVLLNISMMASLRQLPLVASYGLSAISYFCIVALVFLLPCALVSAELATGWPKSGGIYIWVKEALGDRWGFFAIWMQWVHNIAWYPAIMSFIAATLAYVIDPTLIENKEYVLTIVLVGFWGMTLLNYLGIKTSSWVSSIGVTAGTIAPGLLIILLGIIWLLIGNPSEMSFAKEGLLPDISNSSHLIFLSGLFLAFAGLEVSAAYAGNVKDPQKNYPKSIIIAALVTFFLFMLGSLAIGIVIPKEKITLISGLMEAFHVFFNAYHLNWVLPPIAVLLVIGAAAEVNSWIVGPVKGLYATSIHGNLPPIFQKVNKHGTPTNLLLFQAIIVTITSCVFLYMPSINSSYWILTVLSSQSYLIMYILMFIASIRLRYTKPHVPRAYRIPFPHKGIWIIASLGILASLFAIGIGFLPLEELHIDNVLFYDLFLGIGLLLMCAIPLIIYQMRKPSWFKNSKHES